MKAGESDNIEVALQVKNSTLNEVVVTALGNYQYSGRGTSRLSDIDPSTIESINVLMGSAASALYGSNAARGLVVITTKGGAFNSRPKVTFNSQYSLENPILPQIQSKYAQGDRGNYINGETHEEGISCDMPSSFFI